MIRALHRFLVWLVLAPVMFYRRVLSPMKRAPSCIYLPTCSEYAIEAVKTRGILVGGAKATMRILRCNPLFHGGYDPVDRHHRHDARCVHLPSHSLRECYAHDVRRACHAQEQD